MEGSGWCAMNVKILLSFLCRLCFIHGLGITLDPIWMLINTPIQLHTVLIYSYLVPGIYYLLESSTRYLMVPRQELLS